MRLQVIVVAVALLLLLISASACSGAPTAVAPTAVAPTAVPTTAAATTRSEAIEQQFEDFNPNNFARSSQIDHEWFPMKPGTQFVFEGFTVENGQAFHRRLVFTVTGLTKVIEGVRTVVAWIVDFSNDEVVEKEIAFYAQDNDGNVWYLGEYPEEYEDGQFVKALAWIHGLDGAKAGIQMKARPQLGMPSYSAGWGPAVDFTDRAQVDKMGQKTSVPFGNYVDVLVIAESSQREPNAFQLKYYARGVGKVRVGWRGTDATQETLELVDLVQLNPEALAQVHAETLELEKSAYKNSQSVYAYTSPLEPSPGVAKSP